MPDGGKVMVIPRFRPCGTNMAWHSRRTSVREVGSIDSTSLPDSIWERSTISLISSNRCHPERRICSTLAVWASVGGGVSESMSWAKPRIVLSGGAEIMAHAGQEIGFREAGLFRRRSGALKLDASFLQRALKALQFGEVARGEEYALKVAVTVM